MKRALFLAAVVAIAGCGASASPPRPDVGWCARSLGGTPNALAVCRVQDIMHDAAYGPMLRRALGELDADADSAVAARVRAELEAAPRAPPRLGLAPSALVAGWLDASALHNDVLDASRLDGDERSLAARFREGEIFVRGGSSIDVRWRAWFGDASSARLLESKLREASRPRDACSRDSLCLLVHAALLSFVDIDRSGQEVGVRMRIPSSVLRRIADSLRRTGD